MAKRPVDRTPEEKVERLKQLLDGFVAKLGEADLREQVIALVPAFHELRALGSALIPAEIASSARDRIIAYLCKYPRTLIDGDELLVVSGIGEWARRVRELRVEFGWWIYSGVTIKQLAENDPDTIADLRQALGVDPLTIRPDQYVLIREEQDRDAAHRWHTLNTIRRKNVGVKTKILEYLRANVGHPVSIEELKYLANDTNEWPRRARELRTEDGWPVFTKMQGRPDLPVGSYVLDEDKQAEEHDRHIPDDVRVAVLERDHFACTACGWTKDKLQQGDPRKFLELHHLHEHKDRGANTVENLITLCNVDHDQVHRGKLVWTGGVWQRA